MKKDKRKARMPEQETLDLGDIDMPSKLTRHEIDTILRFREQNGKKDVKEYKKAVAEAKELMAHLEEMKDVYRQMDKLTNFLVGFPIEKLAKDGIVVQDNFEKNTAWKSTAFRRFELKRAGGDK